MAHEAFDESGKLKDAKKAAQVAGIARGLAEILDEAEIVDRLGSGGWVTVCELPAKETEFQSRLHAGCYFVTMTANTRLKIGIALAVGGNVAFFTSAWIAWMPWSAATKATLWGILFFTPEVCTLAAVAIMGRENYERFKEVVFTWLGRIKPEGDIGEWRHRIGLVMFFVPLVPTYIQAYKPEWLPDSSVVALDREDRRGSDFHRELLRSRR